MRVWVAVTAVCLFLGSSVVTAQDAGKNEAAPAPAVSSAPAAPAVSVLKAERAVVCSAIENREPVGVANKFPKNSQDIFFFTNITGAVDSATIEHRWYHKGTQVQATVLPVRGARWRTNSKRSYIGSVDWTGEWKVEVIDQATGAVLGSAEFTIE